MAIQRNLGMWVNGDPGREAVRRTIDDISLRVSRMEQMLSSVAGKNGGGNGGLSAQQQSDVAGLIGALGQGLISGGTQDPILSNIGTGNGTVTSVTVAAGTNLTGGGTVNISGTITLNTTLTPSFSSVTITTAGRLRLNFTTPAQIVADSNNYNPGPGGAFRVTTDASHNITGIVAGGDGDIIVLRNAGGFDFVLTNQDAASTAANRIITGTGASVTYSPDDTAILQYDITTGRWILWI